MNTPHNHYSKTPLGMRGVFLFCALIAIDYALKVAVLAGALPHICNDGIAFGITLPHPLFVVGWTVIVGIFLFLWYVARNQPITHTAPYILIVAGGLANLIDRIIYGCVIDYIPFFNFSLFNLADFFIMCGACLLIATRRHTSHVQN